MILYSREPTGEHMNATSSTREDRKTWWETIKHCSGSEADRRNQYRFLFWCLTWAVSFVAANWALRNNSTWSNEATWAVAIAPIVLGIPAVLAYLRFLREADELVRKIQVEGLAFGFGSGVIFAIGYQLLERAGAPELEASALVVVMMVAWTVGQLLAVSRYR